jgi:hypothetical protein
LRGAGTSVHRRIGGGGLGFHLFSFLDNIEAGFCPTSVRHFRGWISWSKPRRVSPLVCMSFHSSYILYWYFKSFSKPRRGISHRVGASLP